MKLLNAKRGWVLGWLRRPPPGPKTPRRPGKPPDWRATLELILGSRPAAGLTTAQIAAEMHARLGRGARKQSVAEELERRVLAGRLIRLGRGVKCDPYRYAAA